MMLSSGARRVERNGAVARNIYNPDSGLLRWLHIVIGNTKALILGTYHGLPKKYLSDISINSVFVSADDISEKPSSIDLLSLWLTQGDNYIFQL